MYLVMYSSLLRVISWALASAVFVKYIDEAVFTSESRCSLLNEDMSFSTAPNSCSITARRSFMKLEVLIDIWLRSRIQFSL